ncbi:hypothetical protein F511_40738 [Dorcoceras hygrometricum]|uniref:Uncharacterized protein n=1 Tax=Dorcoceras hygrometricum TaxID=472368 RepID=A0A2Z7AZ16_9LAMI|nr:hypothetical protein F511_40738 [Dorcoceras hygrometricum]
MQRAASKKRRAAVIGAAVTKKKRSIKKKSLSTLEMVAVAQEVVPIQMIEKIDEQEAEPSAVDETSVKECFVPAVEVDAEETRFSFADDVDFRIQQVIEETREVDAPADKDQPAATEERHWFDLPYEDLIEKWAAERPVRMVTPGSKQAKGFAIQISLLLANIPNMDLGASSEFPASKILTKKNVHRFVSINDRDGAEEASGAIMQRAASKKRRAAVIGAAVTKKKRSFAGVIFLIWILGASSEFPASKILTKKNVHRFVSINDRDGAEEASGAIMQRAASKKRRAAVIGAAVTKKKRSIKKKSLSTLEMVAVAQEVVPIQMIEKIDEQEAEPSAVDETSVKECFVPAVEVDAEETRFSFADDVDFRIQQVIEETREVDAPADKDQPAATEERHWFDLPYEDLIEKWAAERPVVTASDTDEEVATTDVATAGEDQQVQEPLAQISNDNLLDADEQMSLDDIILSIPFDVPLPSSSMEITKINRGEKIKIQEVTEWTWFLHSLPSIPTDDKGKKILVEKDPIKGNPAQEHYFLICADIDLLMDLRAKIIDEVAQFFHSFSLKKLATINLEDMYKKEEIVLSWGETESPQEAIQRKLYILLKYREELSKEARAHGLLWTKTCCSKIFEGSSGDRGAVIPQQVISNEVPCQRQYDDTLPTVSEFFRMMRKRWADICLEVVEFCASRRLLPIGSLQFCRSSSVVVPVSQVSARQSPIFAFRVSQFCSIFVDFSVFNWFPSADISDFLSSIAMERTAFRDVQRYFAHSSSLHFDTTDVDATASSLPPVSQDFSNALADLQAILSEQINDYQSGISSKLHKIEQSVCDSLRDQADIFRNLSQGARQEARTLDDVQTLRFNEFRKNVLAQNASIFTGLSDLFEFHSQAQENHSILHAQLRELVDYIHRGGANKKGESCSRGLQQPSNVQMSASADRTPTFAQRVEMAQRHIVHTVLVADANRELLERQAAAERDRERRRRYARMLKRRRRD